MKKVLIIDDDKNILKTLQIHIDDIGLQAITASSAEIGLKLFNVERPYVVFLDLKLPDQDGLSALNAIMNTGFKTFVVVITAYATIETAVKAIKLGAFDYLPKPFTPSQITHILNMIDKIHSLENEIKELKGIVQEGDFITRNRKMRKILDLARQVADSNAGILICGESGTGKGLLARLIHDLSDRSDGPFVTVSCAALQESLLESDLFGHVKGAFTGALKDKMGKLQLAEGGTVFLDEVSEMSPSVQAKFLHFLQNHEFERLGDPKTINVDVRVIAATNKDLNDLICENLFREDLYYRLNVVELFLPPLRERPEDIEILSDYYLKKFSRLNNKPVAEIRSDALDLLRTYRWPGNVRELVNVIERGVILCRNKQLTPSDLPPQMANCKTRHKSNEELKTIAEVEKEHIQKVLTRAPSMEEAARMLGIDPATLWRKRKKYHLD
ncbi:MAG: sigma-54-dependent Fis family transcriptional regulator [Deltaproteobacteria bacterium]|nr:sigma-54-dependent Fis family transcriptional regulator [Deltaproteobacteria bacterium]